MAASESSADIVSDAPLDVLLDEALRADAVRRGAMFVEDPRSGYTLILDRFAQRAQRLLPLESAAACSDLGKRIDAFLAPEKPMPQDLNGLYDVSLLVVCDDVAPSRMAGAIRRLAQVFHDARQIHLQLYVRDRISPMWDWALPLSRALGQLNDRLSEGRRIILSASGRLTGAPAETIADDLVRQGIRMEHVLPDPLFDAPRADPAAQMRALSEACGLGLRIPVVAYVHAGNRAEVSKVLETSLVHTMNSGFAVRPIQAHPDYGRSFSAPPVEASELLPIAQQLYRRHPHYDDVLEPMSFGVRSLTEGRKVLRRIQLVLDPEGDVAWYRKLPCMARPLGHVFSATNRDPEELRSRVLELVGSPDHAHASCKECQYWSLCGGVDAPRGAHPVERAIAEAHCTTWMFMLNALILESHYVALREARSLEGRGAITNRSEQGGPA